MTRLYTRITTVFYDRNITFTEQWHEPVRTSEEAARIRGSKIEEGAKALIFLADNNPIQIILQGHKKVDKEKVRRLLTFSKLKMASPEEVLRISSVKPGGVPPFGNLFPNPIPVYADKNLLKLEYIEFNAGDQSISIRMKTSDWADIVKPFIFEISE